MCVFLVKTILLVNDDGSTIRLTRLWMDDFLWTIDTNPVFVGNFYWLGAFLSLWRPSRRLHYIVMAEEFSKSIAESPSFPSPAPTFYGRRVLHPAWRGFFLVRLRFCLPLWRLYLAAQRRLGPDPTFFGSAATSSGFIFARRRSFMGWRWILRFLCGFFKNQAKTIS